MGSRKMLMTMAMVALLALPLAACSSSFRLQSAKMCQAAGGTYSGNTCNPGAPNAKTATQMCQAHGGTYSSSTQSCSSPAASTATAQQACDRMGGYYDKTEQHCEVGRD